MSTSNKERAKFAAKLTLGGGLVFYVLHSRMVDFQTLKGVLFNPINLLLSVLFLSFSALCCATRWFYLIRPQKLSLSYKDMVELTMIGNFFNTFMPGSVGGDLIKAWYVAGQEPKRKATAIFTVLLDRVIGLAVIIFYAAVTLLYYRQWIGPHPELKVLALSIWGFTTFSGLFIVAYYMPFVWRFSPTTKFISLLRRIPRFSGIVDASLLYRQHPLLILSSLLLSALSILGINLLYSIQGNTLGVHMDLAHYFFIVPIGITVSAVPLIPGGIGVGQIAFYQLFQWMGSSTPKEGATLCTLMQIYTIFFNCIGAFFYLKFKKRPQEISHPETSSIPFPAVNRVSP